MSEGRPIFHHQHALTLHCLRRRESDTARHLENCGLWVVELDVLPNCFNIPLLGRIHLVDDHHVGAPQVHFPRVVGELMAGAVRIHDDNLKV